MGWIGKHSQINLVSFVVLAIQISQVVLHISRRYFICVGVSFLQKLLENLLGRFVENAMKCIQSSSMCHTHDDMLAFSLRSYFHESSQCRGHRIESFNTESFEISKPFNQKVNETLISTKSPESFKSLFSSWL